MIHFLRVLSRPTLLAPGLAGVMVVTVAGGSPAVAAGPLQPPVRVSVSSAGHQGNGQSIIPSLSADGRYVVSSAASNLVPEATGVQEAVYVRDLLAGTTRRVSVATDGTPSREAYSGTISPDGRYVAFFTDDNTFEPGTAAGTNIFLRDLVAGTTTQVNVSSTGEQPNFSVGAGVAVSTGGRYVVFASPATNLLPGDDNASDVFRRDMTAGRTILVSRDSAGVPSNGSSENPTMTPDGRYVAFISTASNLAPGPKGYEYQVYLRDLRTGTTSWVSARRDGGEADSGASVQSVSADARYVAFGSDATDLVPGDTNCSTDVFVRDRRAGSLRRVTGTGTGTQAQGDSRDAALSADGTRIAFTSLANNLVARDTNRAADVFLRLLAR